MFHLFKRCYAISLHPTVAQVIVNQVKLGQTFVYLSQVCHKHLI